MDIRRSSYQNPSRITSTLQGYVDSLATFPGRSFNGVVVRGSEIRGRALELAIPSGATPEQLHAIAGVIRYARARGVSMRVLVLE